MIEQILYFVLGLATAALLSLLVLPALWRRAYRLTRREIEVTLPLSPAEIAAERDQLRAKFAIEQVRLEQAAEKAEAARRAALSDSGAKALRITDLEDRVTARDATIDGLNADVARLESDLTAARVTIEEQAATLASRAHDIAMLDQRLAALSDDHRQLGDTSDGRRVQIAALETNLEAQRARIGELDRDLKAARASIRTLQEEARAAERLSREKDKEIAVGASRLTSAEEIAERRAEAIAARDAEISALQEKVTTLQREARSRDDILRRETRRADSAEKQAAEREEAARKIREDARETAADLTKTADKLRADRQKLQAELTEARTKAAQLQREVNALKRAAAAGPTDLRPKQAATRN